MKKIIVIALLVLIPLGTVMAQSDPTDPAIVKAKEETAVVFDLGRMFGYLNTMVTEEKKLALSKDQMSELYGIMTTGSRNTTRIATFDSSVPISYILT